MAEMKADEPTKVSEGSVSSVRHSHPRCHCLQKKKNPTKEPRLTTESGGKTFALLSKQDFVPHEAFDIFIYCNKLILYWKITRAEKLNTEMTGDHKVNEDTLDGSIAIKN